MASDPAAGDAALRQAVTFYASFDEQPKGDLGEGDMRLWTWADDPQEKGKKLIREGYDQGIVRIAPAAGVSGGALEICALTPDRAFIYFPAKGKVAVRPDGWGGSVSLWVKADLDNIPETSPWDPFFLVERGWNNAAVWIDFAPGKPPRDLRIGLFPKLADGQTLPTLEEGEKIWQRFPAPTIRSGVWHHLVQTWDNFDTGQSNAWTACYLDGQLMGRMEGREARMKWDIDRVRLHMGAGLVGMIDELVLFNRPLNIAEIERLHRTPDVIQELK